VEGLEFLPIAVRDVVRSFSPCAEDFNLISSGSPSRRLPCKYRELTTGVQIVGAPNPRLVAHPFSQIINFPRVR
ncbi:MAG: hypothetical protein ACXWMI_01865, partial [Syntrophales bacterium]